MHLDPVVEQLDEVQQLPVDVELQLTVGGVANPHRRRSSVALDVVEDLLGEVVAAVDAVHDLELSGLRRLSIPLLEPAQERARLVLVAEPHERRGGERTVADPSEAVIPVALAAHQLRQTKRASRSDRAESLGRQQLDRERRPDKHLRPPPLFADSADPATPESNRRVERRVHPVLGVRRVGSSGSVASRMKSVVSPGLERHLADGGAVLDLQRHVGAKPQYRSVRSRDRNTTSPGRASASCSAVRSRSGARTGPRR